MRYFTPIFAVLVTVMATSDVSAGVGFANMCQRFFPQVDLNYCIAAQEQAQHNLSYAGYNKDRVETCLKRSHIPYGVTYEINYVAAEQCVIGRRTSSGQTAHGNTVRSGEDEGRPERIRFDNGEVLHRSGGGYVGSDGAFYTGAAGGVFNTRTGEFIPTH